MDYIIRMTAALAKASNGNPVISTVTIMLFYVFFSLLEGMIETLIFGERFEHWLDPFFIMAFIAYSAYAVWMCAVYNSATDKAT